MKLSEIAVLVGGELRGDGALEISGARSLMQASPGEIAYLSENFAGADLPRLRAAALILKKSVGYVNEILVANPQRAFRQVLEALYPRPRYFSGISPLAFVAADAVLGTNVAVGHFSWIGEGCRIGDNSEIHSGVALYPGSSIGMNCLIYANVVIYPGSEIGNDVIIHSGAVIGADGFGYLRLPDGSLEKIPQVGRVVVGDGCEIGANSCIDRAALEETVLEENVKLDNLVQVAHNVRIGAGSTLSAQSGIGGSTRIGKNVVFGGQVGVADHISVADGVMAAGQCGITSTIRSSGIFAGMPAQEIRSWRRNAVLGMGLEKILERVRILENQIKDFKRGGKNEP